MAQCRKRSQFEGTRPAGPGVGCSVGGARCRQRRPFVELVGAVVPEPVLTRLVAPNDRVTGGLGVSGGMLIR